MVVLLVGYIVVVLALMVARGAYMSPDLFIILALVIAVVLGRTRLFLRDCLPFAAIFLGCESMRGLADELGAAVHSDDVIAIERFFFFGRPSLGQTYPCLSRAEPQRERHDSTASRVRLGCQNGDELRSKQADGEPYSGRERDKSGENRCQIARGCRLLVPRVDERDERQLERDQGEADYRRQPVPNTVNGDFGIPK